MTVIVSIHSPHPELSTSIVASVSEQGVPTEDHPSLNAFSRALRGDPERVGIIWSSGPVSASDIVRRLRMEDVANVILVLTNESSISSKVVWGRVMVLGAGGDDVQPWPIDSRELIARVRALHGRKREPDNVEFQIPGGTFNSNLGTIRSGGAVVMLTKTEIAVLGGLLRRRGAVIPRGLCMSMIYGEDRPTPGKKIMDVFICKLRKKLRAVTGNSLIECVWGIGYLIPAGGET